MKYLLIVIILLMTFGCQDASTTKFEQTNRQADTTFLKSWLTNVILDYRNNDQTKESDKKLQEALSEDYYRYKLMSITLEYDTLTHEQFNSIWQPKFQTKYVGQMGFFNWCQDCGNIKVKSCRTIRSIGDSIHDFHVVLHDIKYNDESEMDVTIATRDKGPLIIDVKHRN